MNKLILIVLLVLSASLVKAQKVDSIFFHLYTDSLKKGTHNYINVDGKFTDGRWQPMTAKDIRFSATDCEFSGNELIVPADFAGEKITVTAELKSDPSRRIVTTIWVKKKPDNELLPTKEEILKSGPGRKKRG